MCRGTEAGCGLQIVGESAFGISANWVESQLGSRASNVYVSRVDVTTILLDVIVSIQNLLFSVKI